MGAPVSEVKAGEAPSAESLLESFKSIDAVERRRHASVLNYWLSIRGDKDVAPIRDLDPLEISDAGPDSLLLELIGGGEDAEIKHSGDGLKRHVEVFRLSEAARPSLLSCIAGKLAIVAISRNFLAFEDEFAADGATARCWVTLLPFSSTGVWVDYVYAFVSVASDETAVVEEAIATEPVAEVDKTAIPPIAAEEEVAEIEAPVEEIAEAETEPVAEIDSEPEPEPEPAAEFEPEPVAEVAPEPDYGPDAVYEDEPKRPGFSKIFEALTGFHGTNVKVEPTLPPIAEQEVFEAQPESEFIGPEPEPEVLELETVEEPVAVEESPEPVAEAVETVADIPAQPVSHAAEGILQSKLEEVRGKADEARQAKLRSNLALYEGLSAAYDFALDAEGSPEEYLRLVEAQGLKIQLRSPMTPVVKLAFDGLCDESTIGQLEAVLAWALKQDLPRGSLAERIEAAGGIGPILNGDVQAKAA